MQLICPVLSRLLDDGVGEVVSLEIPGLDSLHHFPVLTATTGTVVVLLADDLRHKGEAAAWVWEGCVEKCDKGE